VRGGPAKGESAKPALWGKGVETEKRRVMKNESHRDRASRGKREKINSRLPKKGRVRVRWK